MRGGHPPKINERGPEYLSASPKIYSNNLSENTVKFETGAFEIMYKL